MAHEIKNQEKIEDLGLGEKVIAENRTRFVNRDGSFNVHRKGVFERGAFSPYHAILKMSWTKFYVNILVLYFFVNSIFTGLYLLGGVTAFPQIASGTLGERFGDLFFFSIQVITTLGSSALSPATVFTKTILALEAMTGMLSFALAAGLVFARFSNPAAKIIFSRKAVIAPYRSGTGFMVRIINGRSNEFVEVQAVMTVAMTDKDDKRSFHQLSLEREFVNVFPLNWTIVHPITPESPIYGMTTETLRLHNAEFVVNITAIDEDLSRKVYARASYVADEIAVGKFVNILERTEGGTVVVDPKRVHEIDSEG